jgi:flagellar biosynthetic protein FlhB
MAEERDTDSKTEEATDKKIHDAHERGDVPVSREVPILASLTAILIALVFMVPPRTEAFVGALMRFLDDASGWRLERSNDVLALAGIVGLAAVEFLIPVVVLLMIAGLVASVAQNPPRFVPDRIIPDLSRISPRAGFLRIFGLRGWTEFLKSLLKVFAVGVLVAMILSGERVLLETAMFDDVGDLPQRALKLCLDVVGAVLVATLVVASADLAWARIHWRRDQRMSRHELKEELRQTEGDRMMKARLRSLRLDRSRKRMLAAVPRATMVIANPTHYAVALRYVRSEGGAPIVLAKGVDLIALKIREIAEQHQVPIVEDRTLARALYAAVSVDASIPPEFYRAVAEIVHLIHEKRSSWPIVRNG